MNNKRIFIIEPDRLAGLGLQRELENNGYIVHRPLSLVDTEVIIEYEMPDLIIANSNIQQQKGFERIKKYFSRHQLPVFCTGCVTNEALKNFEGINIIGTFSKPVDSKKIVALVNKYFKFSRGTGQTEKDHLSWNGSFELQRKTNELTR